MTEWTGDDFLKDLEAEIVKNTEKAAIHYKGRVKEAINRSQPYRRYAGGGVTIHQDGKRTVLKKKTGTGDGVYYKGEDPSSPGESPKKITGFLQRSIAHEMDDGTAFVGSNLDYAFYLELGTSKMEARPFFRAGLNTEGDNIARIIAEGIMH